MNKKPLFIFGAGKISEAVSYYFNRDSEYEIIAYVVDDVYATNNSFLGKPLVKLSEVTEKFLPQKFSVFIAIGYQGLNSLRSTKYSFFKKKGYKIASYKSPFVTSDYSIGENTIIMDNTAIQPCVKFGNNVFVWGGSMIGHHVNVEDDCWLTGGCLIGGITTIGRGTFIGLGATIGNEINIGKKCMVGASTIVMKSVEDKSVLLVSSTEKHRLNSDQFTRMSACFRTNN